MDTILISFPPAPLEMSSTWSHGPTFHLGSWPHPLLLLPRPFSVTYSLFSLDPNHFSIFLQPMNQFSSILPILRKSKTSRFLHPSNRLLQTWFQPCTSLGCSIYYSSVCPKLNSTPDSTPALHSYITAQPTATYLIHIRLSPAPAFHTNTWPGNFYFPCIS